MKLICYTRTPLDSYIYSEKLAYSVHLALQEEDGTILPLNHNSGIVYARATQNADGTLNAKNLRNPRLFVTKEGTYGICAERIEPDGTADPSAEGKLLLFLSEDLIHYSEKMVTTEELKTYTDEDFTKEAAICLTVSTGKITAGSGEETCPENVTSGSGAATLPEGAVLGNCIEIPAEIAKALRIRFTTPENIANEVPEQVSVSGPEDLAQIKATARYSDGSSVEKRVDWFADRIDWNTPGTYELEGVVHQDRFEFPVAWNKADPCIGKWNGKYYFISTNDQDHEHSIWIREADSIPALATAQQVKILDACTYPHLGNLLWAPEFHVINDRLYVFHAGTPQAFFEEQSHVMALKEGGNPMKASDWEMPVRVLKKDGSCLYENSGQGITLDMTEFEAGGRHYVCWSQRQFLPVDQGAWLYIAQIDPAEPWKLITDPVVLSMPEWGWANNHTFVDEGPFALKRDGKVYLTFSSAAVDSTYVVGLFTGDENADLTDPDNWVKENCPILSSRSVEGEFGTGHNAYVTDDDGMVWNTYHARPGVKGPRSAGIRRVHFNVKGFPVLDLTEDKDLKPELAWVRTTVVVS